MVILSAKHSGAKGTITRVRTEHHLKTYVVTCDEGSDVYASACDLAREDDDAKTPLGLPREF